jgi:DNA invertase Pin-like site-specific DNA recombinase
LNHLILKLIFLHILSWMAQEERNSIRKRQRVGNDVALRSGAAFGRPKVEVIKEFKEHIIVGKKER